MVISGDDIQWDEYIKKLPMEKRDIYFTRQYCKMEQEQEEGIAQLFIYEEENENIGIYPFIKRQINHPKLQGAYYDIETPYGYGGPITKCADSSFVSRFESSFLEYCKNENIIAEFVRFHPLIKNERIFQKNMEVLHNRSTVWLDLTKSIDDIWMNEVSTQNRNTIRKCEKNQLHVEVTEHYDTFIEIYNETMQKVGAQSFYFFEPKYYDHIKASELYVLFEVKQAEKTLAAAIFMGYGQYFHYHLSGSRKEFLKLAPNNILLWEAIKYAKQQGYKKMHFGGGLTDSKEDNLYRFKSRFSKTSADFYIGKRIHNKEVYQMLIHDWEEKHKEKAKILLQYRV